MYTSSPSVQMRKKLFLVTVIGKPRPVVQTNSWQLWHSKLRIIQYSATDEIHMVTDIHKWLKKSTQALWCRYIRIL